MEKNKFQKEEQRPENEYPTANQPPDKQLIPEKGEEYMREVANIEDMPSPAEEEEAKSTIGRETWKDDESA